MKKKYQLICFVFYFIFYTNISFAEKTDELYKKIDLFSEVLEKIGDDYVDKINQADVMDDAINGMLQSLDPYSAYMTCLMKCKLKLVVNLAG